MNDEGQDSKIVYRFAQIDFCSKYISFVLLKLLSCSLSVMSIYFYAFAVFRESRVLLTFTNFLNRIPDFWHIYGQSLYFVCLLQLWASKPVFDLSAHHPGDDVFGLPGHLHSGPGWEHDGGYDCYLQVYH